MILKQIAFNILVLFNCLSFSAIGQGVTSFWYFGAQAGIQFVNYSPMAILDNGLQMGAGCSSISNSFSELQFYARPDSIHTKSHQAVDGSGEVLGNPITDQGAMLIPIPNDPGKYLFAHIQVESAVRLLRYSIIEKTFYQPEGIILPGELNYIIEDSVQYKMTAVHHANGRDIWLIFRKFYSNKIIALLIGENGQVSNPIVSIVDSTLSPGGQLKASPNGEFLADVHSAESGNNFNASIFLFNNETGSISDEIRIENECEYAYGVEFSRNSRFLYFSSNNSFPPSPILRMDISIYDSSSVLSSLDTIDTGYYWSMQLGIDGKIYLSKAGEPFLSRIDNPDEVNPGSVLVNHSAVSLNGRIAANGLPDFVTSFFQPGYFEVIRNCEGLGTTFITYLPNVDSVYWNFGDPESGNNQSTDPNPTHTFSDTGEFQVMLVFWDSTSVDTFTRFIRIFPQPVHSDFKDTTRLCKGSTMVLNGVNLPTMKYAWSSGATTIADTFDTSGLVWLATFNHCDTLYDTTIIVIDSAPSFTFPENGLICESELMNLKVDHHETWSYLWFTGDTTSSIQLDNSLSPDLSPVEIWLIASNPCGSDSDTMTLTFIPLPDASLPADSVQCFNAPVPVMRAKQDSTFYLWSDGSDDDVKFIDQDTVIWLVATNYCGSDIDSMRVTFHPEIKVELGEDTFICPSDSVVLNASWPGAIYYWTPGGSNESTLTVSYEDIEFLGVVNFIVTITEGPCSMIESKKVSFLEEWCDSVTCKFEVPNVFTPNGDGMNDMLRISNQCVNHSFRFSIYNRWGQLMFFGNSHFQSWDGNVNGEPVADGTYYIVIEKNGESVQRNVVTLFR